MSLQCAEHIYNEVINGTKREFQPWTGWKNNCENKTISELDQLYPGIDCAPRTSKTFKILGPWSEWTTSVTPRTSYPSVTERYVYFVLNH